MYNGESVVSPSSYGELPEKYSKEVSKICEGKTIKELRQIGDYFYNKASEMDKIAETEITMEDFAKIKEDSSDNNEEE